MHIIYIASRSTTLMILLVLSSLILDSYSICKSYGGRPLDICSTISNGDSVWSHGYFCSDDNSTVSGMKYLSADCSHDVDYMNEMDCDKDLGCNCDGSLDDCSLITSFASNCEDYSYLITDIYAIDTTCNNNDNVPDSTLSTSISTTTEPGTGNNFVIISKSWKYECDDTLFYFNCTDCNCNGVKQDSLGTLMGYHPKMCYQYRCKYCDCECDCGGSFVPCDCNCDPGKEYCDGDKEGPGLTRVSGRPDDIVCTNACSMDDGTACDWRIHIQNCNASNIFGIGERDPKNYTATIVTVIGIILMFGGAIAGGYWYKKHKQSKQIGIEKERIKNKVAAKEKVIKQQDDTAINRIVEVIGCNKEKAKHVYELHNKNEQVTINYLLENEEKNNIFNQINTANIYEHSEEYKNKEEVVSNELMVMNEVNEDKDVVASVNETHGEIIGEMNDKKIIANDDVIVKEINKHKSTIGNEDKNEEMNKDDLMGNNEDITNEITDDINDGNDVDGEYKFVFKM